MITLHVGDCDRRLYLWGEIAEANGRAPKLSGNRTQSHPFGANVRDLNSVLRSAGLKLKHKASEVTVWLPTGDAGPIPSVDAAGIQNGHVLKVVPWLVTARRLDLGEFVDLLCVVMGKQTMVSGAVVGTDLTYWADVLRFAGFQVARQQFLPDMVVDQSQYAALWNPVFAGDDHERLLRLVERMPAAARALSLSEDKPPKRGATEVLWHIITMLVDYLVRSSIPDHRATGGRRKFASVHEFWMYALKMAGQMAAKPCDVPDLVASIREWRRPIDMRLNSPFHTCIRLEEPDMTDGDSGRWRIRYLLRSVQDPSLMVSADEVWAGGENKVFEGNSTKIKEFLLISLGRASKISPSIATGLANGDMGGHTLDMAEAYDFLTKEASALQQAGYIVMLPAWWGRGGKPRLSAQAGSGSFNTSSGLLSLDTIISFDWEAALGDQKMTLGELEELARAKAPLVRVRGQWMEVNHGEIQSAISFLKRGPKQVAFRDVIKTALGAAGVPPGLDFGGVNASGRVDEMLKQLDGKRFEDLAQPERFIGTLRPYQIRGYSWLAFLEQWGLGGCLADDMGLGKTIQTLALLQCDWPSNRRPTLLVCPMSVMNNWQREAARFVPDLPVMIYHGANRLRAKEFKAAAKSHAMVITSYGLVQRDVELISKMPWRGVVLDEAQNIKNPRTKQSMAVRQLNADYRFALTGTPVENHLGDLWSIMEFLNPGFLGSQGQFKNNFMVPIQDGQNDDAIKRLKRATGPFILRRLKTDKEIISDLPEKMEMNVFCSLTREQASLYASILNQTEEALTSVEGIKRKGIILSTLSRLKQVCNHPAQFLGDNSSIPNRSGKLTRLTEMLGEVLAVGDRALVFTQFAVMGDILQRHIHDVFGCEVLFLHGGVPRARRAKMVECFQSHNGPSIFVLSLKAGGTGLNLTSANHVFHFDRWWNPAVESQATDRAFRIGQRQNVQVHKMICMGTLEEKIDQMIESKKLVAEKAVGAGEGWLTEMSNDDLRRVLALSREAAGV